MNDTFREDVIRVILTELESTTPDDPVNEDIPYSELVYRMGYNDYLEILRDMTAAELIDRTGGNIWIREDGLAILRQDSADTPA